jgi:hypothetical protein
MTRLTLKLKYYTLVRSMTTITIMDDNDIHSKEV